MTTTQTEVVSPLGLAVVRSQIGHRSDRFFDTVFLGSGVVQAELEEGWPLLRPYLGKWAAFRDRESS